MDKQELLEVIEKAGREGVTELNLSRMGIERLPPNIGQLTNLKSLYLRGNRLGKLPQEIDNLSRLVVLDLGRNELSTFPMETVLLQNLTHLDLSYNQLTELPPELVRLGKLTHLYLRENELCGLPQAILRASNLQVLDLRGNDELNLPLQILDRSGDAQSVLRYIKVNHPELLDPTPSPRATGDQSRLKQSEPSRALQVFVCHSSNDKPAVRGLYGRLEGDGLQPWIDEEDLLPGQDWDLEIRKAVREADAVIVCLSKSSVTKEGYVQKEIKIALDVADEKPEGTIFIIPVKLEECRVPERLSRWQWVNLFEDKGYDKLVAALEERQKEIKRAPAGDHAPEDLRRRLEESEEQLAAVRCPFCKAPVVAIEPVDFTYEAGFHGPELEHEVFGCGFERLDGTPQGRCPLFPDLGDYDLVTDETSIGVICRATPRNDKARRLPLVDQRGETEEAARQKMIELYERHAKMWNGI